MSADFRAALLALGAILLLVGIAGLLYFMSRLIGFTPIKQYTRKSTIHKILSLSSPTGISADKVDRMKNEAVTRWTRGRDGVSVGSNAPDGMVITMDDEEVALSSFFGKQLLVLNFASYSCRHFRRNTGKINALMEKWRHRDVKFLTVYTAEAHTEDGWKLADQYLNDAEYTTEDDFRFYYAKNIEERKTMAEWLINKKHFDMPLVLDSMEDCLLKSYNSWPIRFYIIHNARVAYCGDQGPSGYDPASVDMALSKLLK